MALVSHVPTGYDALTGEVKAWDYTQMLNTEILKPMKILVATEKPFAKKAVDGIREIVEGAGHQSPCSRNIRTRPSCSKPWPTPMR